MTTSTPAEDRGSRRPSGGEPVHRTIVVVDVEGFGRLTGRHQLAVRAGLYEALRSAFEDAGVRWADCDHEDRGDGVLVLVAATVPKAPLVDSLPSALVTALRRHNRTHPPESRFRLRMALHAGEVAYDEHGVTSAAVTLAFRLLDARPFRAALAESPGVLALITSQWFFDEVVRHSSATDAAVFRPVRVVVKELAAVGWISLPDHPYPADPARLSGDVPQWRSSGSAGEDAQPVARGPAGPVDDVLERLAVVVEAQWAGEAELRGLNHPPPLSVRWSAARPEVVDRCPPGDFSGRLSEVADAFERIPTGRLVVLGEPGAGKTAFAVLLLRELHRRRQRGRPVPVVLSISSWNPLTEHPTTWMAAQLRLLYHLPGALELLQSGRILPILDGLDELAAELRGPAIRSLNRALRATDPLVLTSRAQEYHDAVAPDGTGPPGPAVELLAAAVAVELHPLTAAEVEAYLEAATPTRDLAKWHPVFTALRQHPDGPLAQALSTPLMTGLARTSYSETTADPGALLGFSEREDIENALVDTLVPAVYPAVGVPGTRTRWTAAQASTWLRQLARHLDRLGTTDLAWWQLQQVLRPGDFRLFFGLVNGIAVALVGAFTGGVKGGLQHGLSGGLKDATFGLMFGLAAGLAVRTSPEPDEVRRVVGGLLGGTAGGVAYGLIDIAASGFPRGLVFGIGNGAMVGMLVGLTAGLADDMSPSQLRVRVGLGFRRLLRPLAVGVAFGLFLGFVSVLVAGPAVAFLGALLAAIATSLAIGTRGALGTRVDITRAASPSSVWRTDRSTAVVHALVSGFTGAAVVGLVAVLVTGPAVGVEFAVLFGVMYGLAGASFTAWYRCLVTRVHLSLRGRLPWSLMAFLADAHRRGILRQVGAVYQFRHTRLQERLSAEPRP